MRHPRRDEQRASGLAKVAKSNLGKPGLSRHRVVHLTGEFALAEIVPVLKQNILSDFAGTRIRGILLPRSCPWREKKPGVPRHQVWNG